MNCRPRRHCGLNFYKIAASAYTPLAMTVICHRERFCEIAAVLYSITHNYNKKQPVQ